MRRSRSFSVFIYVCAFLTMVVALAPFVWLLISSVAAPADLLSRPLRWIPEHASLSRYTTIFAGTNDAGSTFLAGMVNSLIVASVSVLISLSVGIFGAYACALLRFRFQRSSDYESRNDGHEQHQEKREAGHSVAHVRGRAAAVRARSGEKKRNQSALP